MGDKHANSLVRLRPSKGEVRPHLSLAAELEKFLSSISSRRTSKRFYSVHIPLPDSSFLSQIFSTSPRLLHNWSKALNVHVSLFNATLDVKRGTYEGGFKVWEGTHDLVQFISKDEEFIGGLFRRNQGLKVLELGCGCGLASLAFISRLIASQEFDQNYQIHLQDYNWQVLTNYTMLNFGLNLPPDYFRALIKTKSLRFFYGDWTKFRGGHKGNNYDLILMSETIYDSSNYSALHDLLRLQLRQDGFIVMASKDVYFGLTGGLYSWLDFIATENVFIPIKTLKVNQTNIPRSILVLRKISPRETPTCNFIDCDIQK